MTAAILALALTTSMSADLTCPVMGSPVKADSPAVLVSGASFKMCCAGCDAKFAEKPADYLKTAIKDNKVIGEFLFDPVSHRRIKPEAAKGGSQDYKGMRYYFATEANKKAFAADPAKHAKIPKNEVFYCVVMDAKIKDYSKADSYVDNGNVRYWMCCEGCQTTFEKDPATWVAKGKDRVKPAALGS